MPRKVGDWYHYSGVIHIHTNVSDGTRPLKEIVKIGQSAGLDFMMFTDHMGLANREARLEGWYDKTLAVVGYEHNDADDNNHYLIFGSPAVYGSGLRAKEYVAAARADGALGIIAHPIETRPREGKYPSYPWLEWSTDQFDGLELWNHMSEWMERLTFWNRLLLAFSPRKSLVGPTAEGLQIWDRVNLKRRCVGLVASDAHAFPVKVGPLTVEIFPYKVHFRALRTHIILKRPLADDFETARQQLYDTLRSCRVFCSNVRWGAADGFEFRASNDELSETCGGVIESFQGVSIEVRLPSRANIRLICNGELAKAANSDRLSYQVDKPGCYRVEAWKGKRGWIFSNHIRIGLELDTKLERRHVGS